MKNYNAHRYNILQTVCSGTLTDKTLDILYFQPISATLFFQTESLDDETEPFITNYAAGVNATL